MDGFWVRREASSITYDGRMTAVGAKQPFVGMDKALHSKTESALTENNLLRVPAPDNDPNNFLRGSRSRVSKAHEALVRTHHNPGRTSSG